MAHIIDTPGALRENLTDAGCGEELSTQFMTLLEQGQGKEAIALLTRHRKHLLDCCHAEQRRIDCLDYLVYHMEKAAMRSEATDMNRKDGN